MSEFQLSLTCSALICDEDGEILHAIEISPEEALDIESGEMPDRIEDTLAEFMAEGMVL